MPAKPTAPTRLPASDNLRDVLAYWIRYLRVEREWSQETLALECGLDRTYVSAVERSTWNISLANIERIAQALGVQAWTLLQPPAGSKTTPAIPKTRVKAVATSAPATPAKRTVAAKTAATKTPRRARA